MPLRNVLPEFIRINLVDLQYNRYSTQSYWNLSNDIKVI